MALQSHDITTVKSSDIESAHAATAMLYESENGIGIFDAEQRFLSCNPAYRDLHGLGQDAELIGQTLHDIITFSMAERFPNPAQRKSLADLAFNRLLVENHDRIDIEDNRGRELRITRIVRSNGLIVETINQRATAAAASNSDVENASFQSISRRRLASALEGMADGFAVFDSDGILIAVNERYRELSPHIAKVLVVGAWHEDLMRSVYRSGAVDTETQSEQDFVDFASAERLKPGSPTIDRLTDGRYVRFSGRRLESGDTIFLQSDVSEVKALEERAQRSDNELKSRTLQLETALETMNAGLIMFDADQKLLICNQQYREMLGFPEGTVTVGIARHELIELAAENKLFSEDYLDESASGYRNSINRKEQHSFRYFMTDGRVLNANFTPMEGSGSIVLFTDITAELEAEATLRSYSQKLESSNSDLQNFAFVASHDLQEPLRKIEAFGDRLNTKYGDSLPEGGQQYLERILDASGRMRQLINDLLSFSRVSSKDHQLVDVDLNEVFNGVVSDLQMQVEETGASITARDLPTIMGDATQMRQLFQNLITNALKFSREGVAPKVEVTSESSVELDQFRRPIRSVYLRFSDNGIGFDNRFKDQIFTIFQRLHGRTEYEGTGIGLATVRKIVERHNGEIDADGVEGEGATFIVKLPISQPEEVLHD